MKLGESTPVKILMGAVLIGVVWLSVRREGWDGQLRDWLTIGWMLVMFEFGRRRGRREATR